MNIRELAISEHADESQKISSLVESNGSNTLVVKSYWNKETIVVGLFTNDLDPVQSEQVLKNVTNEIIFFNRVGTKIVPSDNQTNDTVFLSIYGTWADLLRTIENRESVKLPKLRIAEDETSRQNADIKVFFEGQPHPQGKGLGVATAIHDSQTLEIVSVEVHIYHSYQSYQEGILGPVLRHELGHALGLGHSTSMTSIMYNRVVIVNDKVVGAIGECESDALEAAYIQNRIKDIPCRVAE